MDKLDLFGTFNKLCSFICYAHICLLHWCSTDKESFRPREQNTCVSANSNF